MTQMFWPSKAFTLTRRKTQAEGRLL